MLRSGATVRTITIYAGGNVGFISREINPRETIEFLVRACRSRQLEVNPQAVILLRGRSQIQIGKRHTPRVPRRQVIKRAADDRIVRHFDLMPIFEDQDGLRLIRGRLVRALRGCDDAIEGAAYWLT